MFQKMFRTLSNVSSVSSKGVEEPNKYKTKLDQEFEYDLQKSLGRGSYGQIIKAKRKTDNNEFAIKIIKFNSDKENVETIRREANLLSKLNHNHIVRYYNSWMETAKVSPSQYDLLESGSEESLCSEIAKLSLDGCMSNNETEEEDDDFDYDTEFDEYDEDEDDDYEEEDENDFVTFQSEYREIQYLFIQMELCEKRSLRTAIDNNLYLDETKLTKYFKEICEGLSYIHGHNIVHRDLKPENIFLTSDDVIKIGDFGLSKQISLDHEFEDSTNNLPYGSLTATCGTSIYIAPELHNGQKFNLKADIYSLGVLYFEMCSRPMTLMEKSKTFPISSDQWKNINFNINNYKKKLLAKSLLQPDHHDRPTCEQILKIINSEKSIEEIKELIQQNRRVPNQQLKSFEADLKSISLENTDLTYFFLTKAAKIFEMHGGQNIPMPTFLPSFGNQSDDLTTLLNTTGNSTALASTSRIAFSYFVSNKRITNIRRYSIGKVYEEGVFAPTECQECLFEAVTPELNDFVTDAEMMHVVTQVLEETGNGNIYFVINHGIIFSEILRHCKISKKEASMLINALINWNPFGIPIYCIGMDRRTMLFLRNMMNLYSIDCAKKILLGLKGDEKFAGVDHDLIKKAFLELELIVTYAKKFNGKLNIVCAPLSVNQKYSRSFMFKAFINKTRIATGGRFDSLITSCKKSKKRKRLHASASDVSFDVDSIVSLLKLSRVTSKKLDVTIVAKDKSIAISLYTELISLGIKCEIVKKLATDKPTESLVVVEMKNEHFCVAYEKSNMGDPGSLREFLRGNWKNTLTKILPDILNSESDSS